MKRIFEKFQKNMVAATFAEAGEWNTARQMAPAAEPIRETNWLNNIFTAVTFAESGLHDEALSYLEQRRKARTDFTPPVINELGLKGVRVMYGTITI